MKNLFFIIAFFATTLFSSCNEDALDVTFSTSISGDIPVSLSDGIMVYDSSTILNLANSETNNYLNKLKSVTVTKMTYEIVDFTGDSEGKITGDLKADGTTVHSVTDLLVKNADTSGTIFEITDAAALNNIGNKLLNDHVLPISVNGSAAYSGSMDFKVRVTLKLSIVANPLE